MLPRMGCHPSCRGHSRGSTQGYSCLLCLLSLSAFSLVGLLTLLRLLQLLCSSRQYSSDS